MENRIIEFTKSPFALAIAGMALFTVVFTMLILAIVPQSHRQSPAEQAYRKATAPLLSRLSPQEKRKVIDFQSAMIKSMCNSQFKADPQQCRDLLKVLDDQRNH